MLTLQDKLRGRKALIVFTKMLVTFGLVYWLLSNVDVDFLKNSVANINLPLLFTALACHAIAFIIFSVRWWTLLKIKIPQCKYRSILGGYYLGLFWNNFLPTAMGGDIARILKLKKEGMDTYDLLSSTLMDRLIGLVSILLMGLTALIFAPILHYSQSTQYLLVLFLIGLFPTMLLLLSDKSKRFYLKIFNYLQSTKFPASISKFIEVLLIFMDHKRTLFHVLFYSFLAQFAIITCYIFISLSLGIQIPIYVYFSIVPIVFLATSLPLSIGGLGIRESVLVGLMHLYSADTQEALELSIFYIAILLLLTIPGGIFMFKANLVQAQTQNNSL
jgi:uncharacterized protein (TIRG00374 family)